MTDRPGRPQVRFTAGEVDKLLWQNNDVKLYDKGAQRFTNVVNLPQGGFTLRDGTRRIIEARKPYEEINPTPPGAVISAPAGGVAANAVDGDGTTALITNPINAPALVFELVNITMTVVALEVMFYGANINGQPAPDWVPPLVPTGIAGNLSLYILVGGSWVQLEPTFGIRDTYRSRRFSVPPGQSAVISGVRIYASFNLPNVVFRFHMLRIYKEQTAPLTVRIRSFTRSFGESYDFVFTSLNIDVIGSGGMLASVPSVYSSANLAEIGIAQKLATMLVFHPDRRPLLYSNQGQPWEWNVADAIWRNIPNYDYGISYNNGVPAEWTIQFFNFDVALSGSYPMPAGGASCVLTVNNNDAVAIQVAPSDVTGASAVLAPKIKAALEALPGVSPGLIVTQDPSDFKRYKIVFAGVGNEGDGWGVSGRCINKGDAAVTAARTVAGILGGEPIMSDTRGWPRCGAFYQQRLIMGGLKGVPNAVLASQEGDPYQLDTRLSSSSAPMMISIDTEGAEAILHIVKTRVLTFFTSEAEHWLQGNALSRTQTPVIVEASRNGIAGSVRPVASGNSTQYMHRERGTLLDFKFDLSEQNYVSKVLSTPSSSLITGIIDQAVRTFKGDTDVNRLFMVREDGQGVIASLLQEQEIIGYARKVTDGNLEAVNVNGRLDVTWAVRRKVNGQDRQFIERMEPGLLFDQCVTQTFTPARAHITGLSEFEGVEVYVEADREIYGPFTVVAGALDLPKPATSVTVGRWFRPDVVTLQARRDIGPGIVQWRPARVHTVRVFVVDTTSIAVGANGSDLVDVDFVRFGEAADTPRLDRPFTGQLVMEGFNSRFDETDPTSDGTIRIGQTRPGKLTVTAVIAEVDL